MNKRADFTEKTRNILAHRASGKCSNPDCRRETLGAHSDPNKATIIGEAAHIYAARPNGPRPNPLLSFDDLKETSNGIWLCGSCHEAVDKDESTYTAEILFKWKYDIETCSQEQLIAVKRNTGYIEPNMPQMWCHETTDDSDYIPRDNQLKTLNNWTARKSTKVIAITGIGGQGKTSLVGHWVKNDYPQKIRNFDGVFYWSFYSDCTVSVFLNAIITFFESNFSDTKDKFDRDKPLKALRKIIKETNLLLILDGLEMLQNSPSHPSYGQFIENDLRHFLCDICSSPGNTIALLTSRFDIVDLQQYGERVKHVPLENLTDSEGRQLLERFYVGGSRKDRITITQALRGHPLALRIFAAGLPSEKQANPLTHLYSVLSGITDDPSNDLEKKLSRLLTSYESTLSKKQHEILTGVSLLTRPIDESSLIDLTYKTYIEEAYEDDNIIDQIDIEMIDDIGRLVSSGLVYRDYSMGKYSYSCHPIIRDFFRRQFSSDSEKSYSIGSFLANKPERGSVKTIEDIEWYVSAIEIFVSGGNWYEADDIYESKLKVGLVFLKHAVPYQGRRATSVLSDISRISKSSLSHILFGEKYKDMDIISSFYKLSAGRFCIYLGDAKKAKEYFSSAESIYRKRKRYLNQAKALDGISQCCSLQGDIKAASTHTQKSLQIATNENFSTEYFRPLLLTMGTIDFLLGNIDKAITAYSSVIESYSNKVKKADHLAEAYIRIAEVVRAKFELDSGLELVKKGLEIATNAEREDYIIHATWLMGSINYELGNIKEAMNLVERAEDLCRKAALEPLLIRILITQALLMAEVGKYDKAETLIEDCINVSSSREYTVFLIDSILAKININLSRDDIPKSFIISDLDRAHGLSVRCGYRLIDAEISAYRNIATS